MRSRTQLLTLLSLAVAGVYACADSTLPTRRLSPVMPAYIKIKATDSLMRVTDVTYSDTGMVLKRIVPLAQDLTASAVIGSKGGTLSIDGAGLTVDIPAGAVAAATTISVTALAGDNVAYEFQPHGLVFAQPVKVQQQVRGTMASTDGTLLGTAHGGYYDTSIDSGFVDPARQLIHLKEHQIGYVEATKANIKFYIGHFSGYVVTCGKQ